MFSASGWQKSFNLNFRAPPNPIPTTEEEVEDVFGSGRKVST
jgi:hypothetical protein